MSQPTFTIIVPSYNGGEMLRQCIASLQAQKYEAYDVLVLDDGSEDGSVEWLKSLADPRIRVEPSNHVGIVENWRRAVNYPLNEYMTFLGQDDMLDPEFLSIMAAQIRSHPDASLYHAHFRFIDAAGEFTRDAAPMPERETAAEYLRALFNREHETYGSGYVWPVKNYIDRGGIPPFSSLLFADDALWITLMRGSYKVIAREVCFSCRIHSYSAGGSASWRNWVAGMRSYAKFLKHESTLDADFARAVKEYAPAYFLWYAIALYRLALAQTTKEGRRLESGVEQQIEAALEDIAPEKIPEFRAALNSKVIWVRKILNRDIFTRTLYNLYILLRYREWKGKHVSGRTAAWSK